MSDVPTADRDARQADDLAEDVARVSGAGLDPLPGLESITSGLRELAGAPIVEPDERFLHLSRVDDEVRALAAEAVSQPWWDAPGMRVRHGRTLEVARDVFGALVDAYQGCLYVYEDGLSDAAHLDNLHVCRARLVAAGAERVKWERCAGGPAHGPLWRWMGMAFRHSSEHARHRGVAAFGLARPRGASVGNEYLHAIAFATAALDQLPAQFLPVVDRLIDFALPMLQFEPDPVPGAVCCIAPDLASAPQRLLRAPELPAGYWYFSPRVALRGLEEIANQFEGGALPARLGLDDFSGESIWGGLQHLLRHWSDLPPTRRYRRHLLDGQLAAVRGIEDLQRLFSGDAVHAQFTWTMRNASRGGVGATAPVTPEERVQVGELVGLKPSEGGVWQLAVVRRAWEEGSHMALLGLETLTQKPQIASVDDGRTRAEVLLCDPLHRGEAVRVAAPLHALKPGAPLFVTSGGAIQKLKPLDSTMVGAGFELRVYQVL